MRTFTASSLALLLFACDGGVDGPEEDEFKASFETKACDLKEACTGSPCDDTEELLTDQVGCAYDAALAQECLDSEFECTSDGTVLGFGIPVVCGQAYDCG